LPGLDKQQGIVRRVDTVLAAVDRVARQIARAAATLDRTFMAVRAKPFRGELLLADAAIVDEPDRDNEPPATVRSRGGATRNLR
jgi:hypothetical protein